MQKFITKYAVLLIFLGALSMILLYIAFSPITIPGNAPVLLTPLLATFFGATFAFYLNSRKENKKKDEDRVSALRVALFTVAKQQDSLGQVWRTLREWKDRPDNVVNMRPSSLPDSSHLRQDLAALSFMIPRDPTLLLELTLEDERFAQAIVAIKRHAEFHVAEVQPALEKSGLYRETTSLYDLEKAIGGRIYGTAAVNAIQIFDHLVPTRKSLAEIMPKLFKFAKSLYPDERFLKIEFDNELEKDFSPTPPNYSAPKWGKFLSMTVKYF